jgi:hypothetical protein
MEKKENQTAIQQVFSELQDLQPGLFNIYSEDGRNFINHFHKFLAIEKQQIKDAWEDGHDSFSTRNAELYFNETFITEE